MGAWYIVLPFVIFGAVANEHQPVNPPYLLEELKATAESRVLERVEVLLQSLSAKIKVLDDRGDETKRDISRLFVLQNETHEMLKITMKSLGTVTEKLHSFSKSTQERMIDLEKRLAQLAEMKRDNSRLYLLQNETHEMFKTTNKSLGTVTEKLHSFSTLTEERMIDLEQRLAQLPEMKRDNSRLYLLQNETHEMLKTTNKSLGTVTEKLHSFSTSTQERMIDLRDRLTQLPEMKRDISRLYLLQNETNEMFKTTEKSLRNASEQLQSFSTSTKERMIKLERVPESSGVYLMILDDTDSGKFAVSRDFTKHYGFGGDWIVFQRRFNGSVDFNRNWTEYKQGFGDLRGEHWLGLDKLQSIVKSRRHELLIVLESFDGVIAYAHYDNFNIGDESEKYIIKSVGNYTGTAGDSFTSHKGQLFSTYDQDNDMHPTQDCATTFHGAWWFRKCFKSYLNGKYQNAKYRSADGIEWFHFRGFNYSLKSTKMMVRPTA